MTSAATFFRRLGEPVSRSAPILWQLAAVGMGVLLGGGMIFGGVSPFGLALVLGCAPGYLLSAGAGTILGGLLLLPTLSALRMAGAVGAALIMRFAAHEKFWPAAVGGCGAMLVAQLMLGALSVVSLGDTVLVLGTAALAAMLGVGLRKFQTVRPEGACLWLTLCAASLQRLASGWFQPGLILLGIIGLCLARQGEAGQASAFAVAMAAGCAAASPEFCFAAVAMAGGILLASAFCPGEKFGCCVLFLGGCALGVPGAGGMEFALALGASALGASAVFFLLPGAAAEAVCPVREKLPQPNFVGAAGRLNAVAETLADIADTVNYIHEKSPQKVQSFESVIDYAAEQLCAGCGRQKVCWVLHYTSTMDAFLHLRTELEKSGKLDLEKMAGLPGQLCECTHPGELCATLTRGQALQLARREERVRSENLRAALTEQYSAMAEALAGMAGRLDCPGSPVPHKSARLAKLFSSLGLEPLECSVSLTPEARVTALVTVARTAFSAQELEELSGEAGRICRCEMSLPQVQNCRTVTTLLFAEKPIFLPVFGMAGRPADEVSGDAVQQFCDALDKARMLLCDGMGTGKRAAVDGQMAAGLTAKLLRAGFSVQAAARLVNVALSLKSAEEAGATLDILSVDLFSGRAEVFKAGAAPSFLVRAGQPRLLEGISLPVGVLETVQGRTVHLQLQQDDVLVLVSDGVLCDGSEWILQQLSLCAGVGNSPQEMAEILADGAVRRAGQRPDDVTVAVMLLQRSI